MQTLKKCVNIALDNYKIVNQLFNQSIKNYNNSIEAILETFNSYEEKRCKCLEDSLRILCKIIVEKSENMQSPKIEMNEFLVIKEFKKSDFLLEEMQVSIYSGTHPLFQDSEKGLQTSFFEKGGVSNGTQPAVEKMYRKELDFIIEKVWENKILTENECMKLNKRINDHIGRKAWMWSLNRKRSQGCFQLSNESFNIIGELFLQALSNCENSNDIATAKNCLILSQTFYKDPPKTYIQSFIIDHPIWKSINFWEKALDSSIIDELKKQGIDSSQDLSQTKSLIALQLISFGIIMMDFKLPKNLIQHIINTLTKSYSIPSDETQKIMLSIQESYDSYYKT
ncbi:hypothetical protein SteCoe_628 [Stentor coeruleus]|uniref:SBF1/SBF2 domain-containing protein n=1 Tax=Stentor coeruleus TaxID=5963 RepID=A0A1R2D3T2_9CILI|nr:hypothetical protein SteCoe_628 [Stentor coeruleus]